ncbi:MAG: TIGR00300 family protein, partial [Pirellulaceae bacterium]|nr:TIGR00300 family protein [Pirellulaceae bacterium]
HIIDSLLLPKILDVITTGGGSFSIDEIAVGQSRHDSSYARVRISADDDEQLNEILRQVSDHGATPIAAADCRWEAASIDGAFPEAFYSTTNQRTEVRLSNTWV